MEISKKNVKTFQATLNKPAANFPIDLDLFAINWSITVAALD
jgi:hypothetical protein